MTEYDNERSNNHSSIEQVQNQMTAMQESHQRTRDEYERILKQLKQENELLNQQVKQHLTETPSNNINGRKSSVFSLRSFFFISMNF